MFVTIIFFIFAQAAKKNNFRSKLIIASAASGAAAVGGKIYSFVRPNLTATTAGNQLHWIWYGVSVSRSDVFFYVKIELETAAYGCTSVVIADLWAVPFFQEAHKGPWSLCAVRVRTINSLFKSANGLHNVCLCMALLSRPYFWLGGINVSLLLWLWLNMVAVPFRANKMPIINH